MIIIGEAGASAIKMNELYQREVNQLIKAIDTDPEITTIYVWEVSRLARNELAFAQMKDTILRKRIQLICNVPQLRLFDDNGELNTGADITLNLLITLARQEMEIKAKRFARGRKRLAEQGKYNGGAIPYGYKIDRSQDNLIVIDEEVEAPIVREVFNMYEQGYSQMKIAKELTRRGVKGRSVRVTNTFTISLVHQLLTNRLLTGEPQQPRKGCSYVRQYPQIITTEQFERCRKIAELNNTNLPKTQYVHYARGILKCKDCGKNFISTGQKGYYRCRDTWNTNIAYYGYVDTPLCNNKLCISTNIMDSLLWELGKTYETRFIMQSAKQKLEECQKKAAILQQKLGTIPSLLSELEDRKNRLYEAYVDGMRKELYNKKKQALTAEEKEIHKTEAEYREQLNQIREVENEITNRMNSIYGLDRKARSRQLNSDSLAIRKRVNEITDDEERSKIIHKHIEKVVIDETTIKYKFAKYPEEKDVPAKVIYVYPYTQRNEVFYFVPNDGKGGIMLQKDRDGGYRQFRMIYLPRIFDKGKRARRELTRAKREEIRTAEIDRLRQEGYISINEMREMSGLSDSTIRNAITDKKLDATNVFRTWYAKKVDFERYLAEYKPQPRPYRQKYAIEKGYDKEKRIMALMEDLERSKEKKGLI